MASNVKPKQRTRIDWGTAKARFVALAPSERTYTRISREFHVSLVTIRKHARRDGWVKAAADADAAANAAGLRRARRTREDRVAKMLELVDGTLDRFDTELGSLDLRVADLAHLGKFAELLEGEATDRVSFGEMQEALTMTLETLLPYVAKAKRAEALEAVRVKLGAIEAQAA